MNLITVNQQLWQALDFFEPRKFRAIKDSYRKSRWPFGMQYDDRLLTPWSDTPQLQELVVETKPIIEEIVGKPLNPQVAYVSIDLANSHIMMHRLHPDIFVQVQITMSEESDSRMDFAFCHDRAINADSEIDYRPNRPITRHDVDVVAYAPNVASIYLNEPRCFVGMLGSVPPNSVREVLLLTYTRMN